MPEILDYTHSSERLHTTYRDKSFRESSSELGYFEHPWLHCLGSLILLTESRAKASDLPLELHSLWRQWVLSPHSGRHNFFTNCLRDGNSIKVRGWHNPHKPLKIHCKAHTCMLEVGYFKQSPHCLGSLQSIQHKHARWTSHNSNSHTHRHH